MRTVALADPKIKARLVDLGGTVLALSPADYGKLNAAEIAKWAKVVKFSGARPRPYRSTSRVDDIEMTSVPTARLNKPSCPRLRRRWPRGARPFGARHRARKAKQYRPRSLPERT
jgi:hypothetical protein